MVSSQPLPNKLGDVTLAEGLKEPVLPSSHANQIFDKGRPVVSQVEEPGQQPLRTAPWTRHAVPPGTLRDLSYSVRTCRPGLLVNERHNSVYVDTPTLAHQCMCKRFSPLRPGRPYSPTTQSFSQSISIFSLLCSSYILIKALSHLNPSPPTPLPHSRSHPHPPRPPPTPRQHTRPASPPN